MAVAFLCARVQKPDNDYKKLAKVMRYLHGIRELTLTIELSNHPSLEVGSSNTLHPYRKSNSGIFMTLAKGATYRASSKQKLNTKSSTAAELGGYGQLQWHRSCGPDIS